MVKDWAPLVPGAVMIALGLAYFFSHPFRQFAYRWTTQGVVWKWLVGERWAPVVSKYFFSIVAILAGAWYVYSGIAGWDAIKTR